MRTLTSLLIAALLLMTAAAAPAATVDGATIHWTLMFPDRVKGLVLVDGLVQLPATGIQPGQPGRGPLPAVTIASREAMVKGMFGPATIPELQQHILR